MLSKFIKKQALSFYLTLLTFVCIVIGMAVYISNATGAYYNDLQVEVILMTIFALILCGVVMIAPYFVGEKQIFDLAKLLIVVLLGVILVASISKRVESMGYILFSDLESGNKVAVSALNQYFVCFGAYLVGLVSFLVAGFSSVTKKID